MKITVVIGSNRKENRSSIIAGKYVEILKTQGINSEALSMREVFKGFDINNAYDAMDNSFEQVINSQIGDADKLVFVIPEYNGSYPGALKLLIDSIPPAIFNYKKAGLIGIASGRAGNIVGLNQFVTVLNHVKVNVMHNKLILSGIDKLIIDDVLVDDFSITSLEDHAAELIKY